MLARLSPPSSLDDLVVGAPMFMRRGSNGRLEELGKVYVYLQRGPLQLEPSQCNLLGEEPFGRFGTSVAPLGDLNQDGFNGTVVDFKASNQCFSITFCRWKSSLTS